jgi:hypothetical protein
MNAVTTWDPNSGGALPAHLANAFDELGSNIADRMNVPSVSYEGKMWTIVKDGNKTKLQTRNDDGDTVPVPVMRVVVLNFNDQRGRAYYEGQYNPAASAAPKCWSADGVAPDDSVREKINPTCKDCPMSVKGSKVQDGKEMVACSSHRMLAVIPANDLTFDPLRLKIAVTSDYDKDNVEHGWFAFRQYVDFLKSRGIGHTALVVTKMKFDPNPAYPKILFSIDRPLTESEMPIVIQAVKSPKVVELLAEKWTAAGTAGTPKDDSDIKPYGLEGAYLDGWKAHPDAAGYSFKDQEVLTNEALAAKYPAPPPAPVKAPEPKQEVAPAAPPVPASEMVIENTPPVPAHPRNALEDAAADGWAVHPNDPTYWFKGQEVLSIDDVKARYPAQVAAAPTAPPAPPAPPPAPVKTPEQLATEAGWAVHPTNPAYWFKDQEVLETAVVMGKFGSASAGTAEAGAASTNGAAGGTSSTSTTATTGASPSSAEVPADVQDLLNKWTGGETA